MQSFVLGTFNGNSGEVRMLLRGLMLLRKDIQHTGSLKEKTEFYGIYDRLVWCDRLEVHFHPRAVEGATVDVGPIPPKR